MRSCCWINNQRHETHSFLAATAMMVFLKRFGMPLMICPIKMVAFRAGNWNFHEIRSPDYDFAAPFPSVGLSATLNQHLTESWWSWLTGSLSRLIRHENSTHVCIWIIQISRRGEQKRWGEWSKKRNMGKEARIGVKRRGDTLSFSDWKGAVWNVHSSRHE